jgi:phage terminase large subunit
MEVTREKRRIKATRLFYANKDAIERSGKRYIVNEGGTRSSKSYSIMMVLIMMARNTPGLTITVTSRSLPHLKKGALRDFMNIMKAWGWYREAWHNKTDEIYTFPNGSYIEFFGLETPDRALGPGRKILFINECNLIGKPLFDQLNNRTEETVILDLNPAEFDCWAYHVADGPDAVKIHSTYLDNPSLPAAQRRVIESYRDVDPNGLMWKVYGLGLRGASERQIYTHYKVVDELPGKGAQWYGLDFGFNVPTALVRIELYDGEIYLEQVIYETRIVTSELIKRLERLGISSNDEIYCDAAEPKTIQEMINAGFNALPADKDVTEGIRKVKSLKVYVTRASKEGLKELGGYFWKENKDGKILDEPNKDAGDDHFCDAARYGIFTKLRNPETDFFIA